MSAPFYRDRNVFVTGATGLLGSWMTKELLGQGANVIALVRDMVPKSEFFRSGAADRTVIVRGALEDDALLERALNEYEIDTIFHLGAQTIVGTANRSPISTFESNIKGTWNILEAARRSEMVGRVLVASSDKAYGEQDVLPYTEEQPLIGRHPYDVSKSCADLLAQSYAHSYGVPVAITRCGNLFGGGDLNFNRLIPGTIKSVLNNRVPVIRSDGSYIRDYFFVNDAVDACLALGAALDRQDVRGRAFNFSNELQITVAQMAQKIIDALGSDLKLEILDEAKNEIRHQYLSAERARTVLGWRPVRTLEEGLAETIEWYREFLND